MKKEATHIFHIHTKCFPQVYRLCASRPSIEYNLIALETRLRNIRNREKTIGKLGTCTCVYDMEHCTVKTFAEIAYYLPPLIKECEANYPGTIGKVIFINSPAAIASVFKIVSAVLPKRADLYIFGTNYKEDLLKLISEANLPKCYFGIREDIFRTFEESTALPLIPVDRKKDEVGECFPDAPMKEVKISARGKAKISMNILDTDEKLQWWFDAKGGGIEFAIYRGDEEDIKKLVVPKFTSYTGYVSEKGECKLDGADMYTIVFTNHINYLSPIILHYKLVVQ